jgi:Domain of unknown function (DUF4129)
MVDRNAGSRSNEIGSPASNFPLLMQPLPGSGRGTRLSLLGLGLLVLLSVVAFASRSGLGRHSHTAPSQGYVNYAVTVFLILFVLMIPVAVYAFALRVRERAVAPRKSFQARMLAYGIRFAAMLLIAFVAYHLRHEVPHLLRQFNPWRTSPATGPHAHGHGRVKPQTQAKFEWSVLWIALVVLASTAGYGYYRWKAGKAAFVAREVPLSVSEDIAATIGDAIDDLEAEPDARKAVIAAYARMEAVLSRNGYTRAPSETAIEYLRRILLELTSRGDAVSRLTTLFEQAKFSQREIDGAMKQDAIGALREIRDGLDGAPA